MVPEGGDAGGAGDLEGGHGRGAWADIRGSRSGAWRRRSFGCVAWSRPLPRGASIDDAARLLDQDIRPIDDLRSTAAYRRDVAANLLRRFWADTEPAAESA